MEFFCSKITRDTGLRSKRLHFIHLKESATKDCKIAHKFQQLTSEITASNLIVAEGPEDAEFRLFLENNIISLFAKQIQLIVAFSVTGRYI